MKAFGYARVSTASQVEDGVSLEVQEAKFRAWADLNGYDQVEVCVDAGISGSTVNKRPALLEAIKCVGKGDALVVYSLSRLARSTKDTLEIADMLMNKGADLVSLSEKIDTTTAAGKMVFRMLAVLSEFERDQLIERTKGAMTYKKSKGERVGFIPFGLQLATDGKTLEECHEEQDTLAEINRLRSLGFGYLLTARELNAQGFTNRGKAWNSMNVKSKLQRAA
jgi:DNA invertase Pin-like site-specific DNA recombinase